MTRPPKERVRHAGATNAQSLWWGWTAEVRDAWVLRVILWAAIAAELSALVLPIGTIARITVGVVALVPLMWIPAQIERLYLVEAQRQPMPRIRRFLRLRSLTEIVLAEIRRMNWLGFDLRRGAITPAVAEKEMAAIESRLRSLISEIRHAAGRESPEDPAARVAMVPPTEQITPIELVATVN